MSIFDHRGPVALFCSLFYILNLAAREFYDFCYNYSTGSSRSIPARLEEPKLIYPCLKQTR